ncbi:hypothetical protein [Ramlibacter rhizophilus]|uniref:Uncharacterized protein n=1 Tax=Ramlibacter rhizophilus TaxID=1781167 RepID=A0A4Z0BD31_9BURK|nr:hypothetical protein [Ramlibacter rhizophilus]TFY96551.1 hypothetical protein EZ242_21250 [Ramlibacter rhizophilus]
MGTTPTGRRRRRAVRGMLLAGLAAGACGAASAQDADCRMEGPRQHLLLEREAIIQRLSRLPDPCLKSLFHACSAAAGESLLDGADAALCSMSYEALLRRSFNGDFQALLAWWRNERKTVR